MNVDHFCTDSICSEFFRRFQGRGHANACSHDRHIASFTQKHAFSDLKLIVFSVINHRNRCTSEAQIYRSLIFNRRFYRSSCFHSITGVDDHHSWDHAHQGQIFQALMRCAVLAHRDSCMGGADLHIQMRISDGIAHLFIRAARRKHSEGRCKRDLAYRSQPGRDSHHIRFRDTAVDMAIRKCLLEGIRFGGIGQICVQNHQIGVLRPEFGKRLAVSFSCRDLLNILYF